MTNPSGGGQQQGGGGGGLPKCVLSCRTNSHPFQERVVFLSEPQKVGRSVGRTKPAVNNTIFDCKVLSRNHALLWYEAGQFWVQDTKSSNGTFVNNQRLNRGNTEESPPKEIYHNDVIQFGVDVVENQRNGITHGCIIGDLYLYHPDGSEAKPSQLQNGGSNSISFTSGVPIPSGDLYLLQQYLEEATHREQMLETKLATLQRIVDDTQLSSSLSWQALVDEDRMLTRLEMLEAQLAVFTSKMPPDSLQNEIKMLAKEKEKYAEQAKEKVQKAIQEKCELQAKLSDAERLCRNADDECDSLRLTVETTRAELAKVAEDYEALRGEHAELKTKLEQAEKSQQSITDQMQQEKSQNEVLLESYRKQQEELEMKLASYEAQLLASPGSPSVEVAASIESSAGSALREAERLFSGDMEPTSDRKDDSTGEDFGMSGDDLVEFPIESIFSENGILLEALHADFKDYSSALEVIAEKLASEARNELQDLREKMARSVECIEQLKEGFESNTNTIQEMTAELEKMRSTVSSREMQLNETTESLNQKEVEVVALQEQLVSARISIKDLKSTVEQLNQSLIQSNERKQGEIAHLNSSMNLPDQLLASGVDDVAAGDSRCQSMSEAVEAAGSSTLEADVQHFQRAPVKVLEKLKRSEADRERLQLELQFLQTQMSSNQSRLSSAVNSLQNQLNSIQLPPNANQTIHQLFGSLAEISSNLDSLQSSQRIVSARHAELVDRTTSDSIVLLNTMPMVVIILAVICALFKAIFPD